MLARVSAIHSHSVAGDVHFTCLIGATLGPSDCIHCTSHHSTWSSLKGRVHADVLIAAAEVSRDDGEFYAGLVQESLHRVCQVAL